jgi:hypothetical protein
MHTSSASVHAHLPEQDSAKTKFWNTKQIPQQLFDFGAKILVGGAGSPKPRHKVLVPRPRPKGTPSFAFFYPHPISAIHTSSSRSPLPLAPSPIDPGQHRRLLALQPPLHNHHLLLFASMTWNHRFAALPETLDRDLKVRSLTSIVAAARQRVVVMWQADRMDDAQAT